MRELARMSDNNLQFAALVVGPIVAVVATWAVVDATLGEADDGGLTSVDNAVQITSVAWGVTALLIVAFFVGVGKAINGDLFGSFIDERNRYSLSRTQLIMWTTLVISAWLSLAIVRIAGGISIGDALAIDIPGSVVAALGLSAGSFAIASGVKNTKKRKRTARGWRREQEDLRRTIANNILATQTQISTLKAEAAGSNVETEKSAMLQAAERHERARKDLEDELVKLDAILQRESDADGLLVANDDIKDARPSDIFTGDEVNEAKTTDISKVQMFFLTVAIVGSYGLSIASGIDSKDFFADGSVSLPDLPDTLVALLGLSHAGYIAVKVPDTTDSERMQS
jgi:hypothetical protein